VAISEAVKEIKFIYYLLRVIGIEVKLPIIVKTDNVGAIFMAQNSSFSVRTRNVNTRYHFVQENLEDGNPLRTDQIFSPRISNQEIYERHVEKFLEEYIKGEFNG
jgi:hypothetical protein